MESKTAIKRMQAPAFRRKGRQYVIHEIAGVPKDKWDEMPFPQKIQSVQDYYITLTKRPKLTNVLRKHMNAMKRWFNIQKRKHKPWRSRIQNFFDHRVKRIRDKKVLRDKKMTRDGGFAHQDVAMYRALVRLAYQKPELRGKLLPLILGD